MSGLSGTEREALMEAVHAEVGYYLSQEVEDALASVIGEWLDKARADASAVIDPNRRRVSGYETSRAEAVDPR